ncbi:MAG: prepilin-type N-terminal cleavage/methylation domain-containing protein [Planctomycetes bacterium]|nr:prepilin-type N-terminal cleavage/methylation domain-containing protein [Planctomycetota bacterium]
MRTFQNRARRAFTLIEILIVVVILGILAAIVIPQFTDASDQANVASMKSQLQTMRSQIELFRIQDVVAYNAWDPIAAAPGTEWDPLISGDYLQAAPRNPITNESTVEAAPRVDLGWVWRDKDGAGPSILFNLYGVDETGLEFDETR